MGISIRGGIKDETIGAVSLIRAIRTARNNPLVKAIVLRVNSGEAAPPWHQT